MAGPAPSARAIFQAHTDGVLPESVPVDLQWTLLGTVLNIQYPVTLNNGDNTLSFPAAATLLCVVPPTTNSVALKLKGAGGDTGFTLQPNAPNVFTYFAGNVIINAGGSSVSGVKLIAIA